MKTGAEKRKPYDNVVRCLTFDIKQKPMKKVFTSFVLAAISSPSLQLIFEETEKKLWNSNK